MVTGQYWAHLNYDKNRDGSVGLVSLLGKSHVVVPASHTIVIEGAANVPHSIEKWVIVEHPTQSSLPGGLSVQRCLITLPANALHKVPSKIKK